MNYISLVECLGLIKPDPYCYEQNMNQANIHLLPLWRSLGNTGDLPTGWNGPPSAADQARELADKQKAETLAINQAQEAKQNDFLTRFRTAIGTQEKIPDMVSRIGGELNLPALNQTASGAIQNLAQMPKVQTDASRGFNVNSNQLARIISAKQAEFAPVAQQAVTQQQEGERQLGTRLGFETAQQQKELTPFTSEQGMLSEQLAREFSGFTQDKQNQLQLVMQQISNGQALTLQQLQNANSLAVAKINFENQKQELPKLLTLSEGQTVYDPTNKSALFTAPKTYKPLTGTSTGW